MKNDEIEARDRAANDSQLSEVIRKLRDGWVLVPEVASKEMIDAAWAAALAEDAREVWIEMVAVAKKS